MSEYGNTLPALPPGQYVRIWRIEHPTDGIGPFFTYGRPVGVGGLRLSRTGDWVHPINMPGPGQDTLLRNHGQWGIYAFPSAKALVQWFSGAALLSLTAMGYVVRLLAVPMASATRYRWQVLFRPQHAVVMRTMAPADVMWCVGAPRDVPQRWNTDGYT